MKDNRSFQDRISDILLVRARRRQAFIREKYKGTKPYRAVKVSDDERIAQYLSTPPEDMQRRMQNFPGQTNKYVSDMETLIRRQGK